MTIPNSNEYEVIFISDEIEGGSRCIELNFDAYDEDEQEEILALKLGCSITFERGMDDLRIRRIA